MSNCEWTVEETTLLIQKRLEMFRGARSDKVYDQISDYLVQKHNIHKNASACQSRFNNVLKTYRLCVKRLTKDSNSIRKMRFPFFDIFHQYYTNKTDEENASSKCKSEIFLVDIYEDSDGEEGGSMMIDSRQTDIQNEHDGHAELTANNGLNDLKLRLMEQKLLYYTNQNMLQQVKQEHYRQEEQERAREQLTDEEIQKVLRGIHSCLIKSQDVKIVPPPTKKVDDKVAPQLEKPKITKEMEGVSLVIPIEVESGEEVEDEFNGEAWSASAGSSEEVINKAEKARLKVRKNIFPAWNRIQTVLLIKIHCDLRPKFKGFNLFECISNKLIELHINRTPRDCRTRWNNLFRSYKECRSRLQLNGKAVVKFEYFDEIDAYYKDQQFLSM
ncbi:uncharacterized protein LOC135699940 [Ochlerotatus camptorhynchus]|uniref:uncharacterized protein LOC135699940 n=1 Tax=Ochlerotatus camptorhynchus TaxID=644619 RepID=UPI0031DF9DAB